MIGQRTDFLFATPTLFFGRTKPGADGGPDNAVVLRVLPCRTPELDPINYASTVEISAHHGEFVLGDDRILLVDRSSRGMLVDGVLASKTEPLPPRFTLELAGSALRLAGRVVADPATGRPAGLRLERLENAPHHAYVWVIGRLEMGPLDGAIPIEAEPAFGASVVNAGGRLDLFRPPDLPRPLRAGEAIKGRSVTLLVGELNPNDMTTE